jgi:hypothetical protein
MRRSLPVFNVAPDALDLVEIPIPCDVPWDGMRGDEQVRHCAHCKQNVYNVSAFTRAEAMRLLQGRACLRIYRRPDNTVITSDCRERLRAARKRGLLIFAGTLVIVLWAQICAQFVGMMGLKRLLGRDHTTGAAVPVPAKVVVPAPRVEQFPTMGVPPDPPSMGLPDPPRYRIGAKGRPRQGHHTTGVPHAPTIGKREPFIDPFE